MIQKKLHGLLLSAAFSILLARQIQADMVVFSEIMYNPPAGKPEFIEVSNITITPLDIANWKFTDGIKYEFPSFSPASSNLTFLKPFERILLSAVSPAELRAAYEIPASVRIYGPYGGNLDPNGARLTLKDKNGAMVCTVQYRDRGHWPAAADGAGHSIVLKNVNKSVDDWHNWAASPEYLGTPGRATDFTLGNPGIFLNEVHVNSSNVVDWVELVNVGSSDSDLSRYALSGRADATDKVALGQTLRPGAVAAFDVQLPLKNGNGTLYLIGASNRVVDARIFDTKGWATDFQAFPAGSGEWYASTNATRNGPNTVGRNTQVVINEIMFDPPGDFLEGEYIELFNRGTSEVDLSNWQFSEGVSFTFPPGTKLAGGGYLVIAADEVYMRKVYGNIPVIGNYTGTLANSGELLRLEDANGNLVNQVDYLPGGDWPEHTKGGGSSMELQNPFMDNTLSSAWKDSDETSKAPMREYSYRAPYRQLNQLGGVTDYKELHLHLVGDSHVVLENIQLIRLSAGTNLIVFGDRLATNVGSTAQGWVIQGTHWASYFDGAQMHLISDGRGDNRPNKAEIDITGVQRNDDCELRFKARWVYGNPRLIAQTWDHSIAASFRLEIPKNLGTPGGKNSRWISNPAPEIEKLSHSPAVPKPAENVTITARVSAGEPLKTVQVIHRLDDANASGVWKTTEMFDDGAHGDGAAGDGIYGAVLTDYKVNANIAQFYVRAETQSGQTSFQPRQAASKPAMFVVDSRTIPTDFRTTRFVISLYDTGALNNGGIAKYAFKFPRLQNHYMNATLIVNEKEITYNAEIRQSGSPWTRAGLERGKWKVPDDRLFRGHYKESYDNDAVSQLSNNRVTRYMLYLMGIAVNENEMVRVIINNGATDMREETEPVDNDFLNRNYENGSKGDLYRIDDEWAFLDIGTDTRFQRDASWQYKTSDNAGRYRTEWMKRTNEDEDDFSDLISFFKTLTTPYNQDQIWRYIDIEATMKMAAVRGYIYDWDSFTLNRGKNGFFYRRSDNGLFEFLHWDSDNAFQDAANIFNNGVTGWSAFYNKPYNKRLYMGYLAELIENYTKDSPRMYAWLQAEEDASPSYSARATFFKGWYSSRLTPARTFLGANYRRFLDVPTNAIPASTTDDFFTLSGTAPYGVLKVAVLDHPEAKLAWSNDVTWVLSGIRLKSGLNQLEVVAQDEVNSAKGTNIVVAITKSTAAALALSMEANPASWHTVLGESISLDASGTFDPDDQAYSLRWSVSPATGVQLLTNRFDKATFTAARPGLYNVTLQGIKNGVTNQIVREVAVSGASGFSSFGTSKLESFWNLNNITFRDVYNPSSWYSLLAQAGGLIVEAVEDSAKPVATTDPAYPFIWRSLPATSEWALQTRAWLENQQYGDFYAGLMIEVSDAGKTNRFALGMDGGNAVTAQLIADGATNLLKSAVNSTSDAVMRMRRDAAGQQLLFEQRRGDEWILLHAQPLAAAARILKGGIFLSTRQPITMKTGFDYVLLVDPSSGTELQQYLRLTEIMYNPPLGDNFEFLELMNIGSSALDLTGAQFTSGISYVFPKLSLAAGQRLVLVKDQAAFATLYKTNGLLIAPGGFGGKLDNGGETLTLADAAGSIVFAVTYGDSGGWPSRPDGDGSSLEILDPLGNPNSSGNWRASLDYNGSPGTTGSANAPGVVINEVLTHSELPLEDAIELFNNSASPIDVSGWFLSDSRSDLKKFRIPSATVIPASGFAVFYEKAFNTNNTLTPFSLSSAQGDELYLTSADAVGNLLKFADTVSFGPAENGVSFGRFPNGAGPLVPMSALTFGSKVSPTDPPSSLDLFRAGKGASNALPKVGPIVLSKIMYHPAESEAEFVELKNITTNAVSLFDPAAPTNHWKFSKGFNYEFPGGTTVPGMGTVIVSFVDPARFRSNYNVAADVQVLGPAQGQLDNNGDTLELVKPDGVVTNAPNAGLVPYVTVEKVGYEPYAPWPVLPYAGGVPLVRRDLQAYGNDPANWIAGASAGADSDGDGIPDEWEIAHGLNPNSSADALLDPDGDGLSNLQEYLAGTNPQDRSSTFLLGISAATANGVAVSFTAAAGKTYSLLYADAVVQSPWKKWSDVGAHAANGPQTFTVPIDANRTRYFRLVTPKAP